MKSKAWNNSSDGKIKRRPSMPSKKLPPKHVRPLKFKATPLKKSVPKGRRYLV